MARRKREDAEEVVEQSAAPDPNRPDPTRFPSKRKLAQLIKDGRAMKQDIDQLSLGFGSQVKDAAENHNLHRKAFAIVRQLDRLEPAKLNEALEHLYRYLEDSGLNARAATAPSMQFEEAEGEEEGNGNIRPFPRPDGIAAE